MAGTDTDTNGTHRAPPRLQEGAARAEIQATIRPLAIGRPQRPTPPAWAIGRLTPGDVPLPPDFYDLLNLDPAAPKPDALTNEQQKAIWKQAFFEEKLTLEETLPHRVRTVYRLIRALLRLRQALNPDTALHELRSSSNTTADAFAGWTTSRATTPASHSPDALRFRRALEILRLVPLPILPPEAPAGMPPGQDKSLRAYVDALQTIAEALRISQTKTRLSPNLGRYGLLGVLDPLTIRLVFPSPYQLIEYEQNILVPDALESLIRDGYGTTITYLRDRYGFEEDEAIATIRMARIKAQARTESDVEQDRAIMLLRLEDLYKRAKLAFMLRDEIYVLKQIAIVQGMAKIEPEDTHSDFTKIVGKVAREAPKEIRTTAVKALPHED